MYKPFAINISVYMVSRQDTMWIYFYQRLRELLFQSNQGQSLVHINVCRYVKWKMYRK